MSIQMTGGEVASAVSAGLSRSKAEVDGSSKSSTDGSSLRGDLPGRVPLHGVRSFCTTKNQSVLRITEAATSNKLTIFASVGFA
jgi:hypothetical protein